jgi:ketosteroid isomerase-like protein
MRVKWAGVALVACSPEAVARPPAAPVTWQSFDAPATPASRPHLPTEKERPLAEKYAGALASPGFAQLASLLDHGAHFSFPGIDDAYTRDAVVRAHDVLFGAFDQRRFVTTRVWRTAGEQTAEWTMAGVQARDWMRVAATQKPVVIRGVTLLWTTQDGSIADIHVYFDVVAVKGQLGAAPKGLTPIALPPVPAGPPQLIDQNGHDADNVRTVRTDLDALETSESKYVAGLTDDVEVFTLERTEPARGKEDARRYFKEMHRAIGEIDTTIVNGWGVGTFAIVEYWIDGQQWGPMGWIPPQRNAVVRLHVVDVNELRDGRIARIWRYDNPVEITSPGP